MIGITELIGIGTGTAAIGIVGVSYWYIVKYSKPPSHGNGGHRKYKTKTAL